MRKLSPTWPAVTLADVARLGSGGTPRAGTPRYYDAGDIPWAVIGDLNDAIVWTTQRHITAAGVAESAAKIVPAGTVLLAMYGSIGKLGIAGQPMATNQAIATLQPHEALVTARWLFWYLSFQQSELERAGKGAAQRNISQSLLRGWPVPLPPLDEQDRIVAVLEDHLYRLDAASVYLSAAARRTGTWERVYVDAAVEAASHATCAVGDLVERVECGRSFGGSAPPAKQGEWGVIRVSAMTWGEFRPDENKAVPAEAANPRYLIRAGDLLVSRANTAEYVGAPVLVRETRPRLLLSDKSLRLVPKAGVDAAWLVLALASRQARGQISALATGTKDSMRNISQGNLAAVRVPAPPDDQRRLVEQASAVRHESQRLLDSLLRERERAQALRGSVLAAAFAGRL